MKNEENAYRGVKEEEIFAYIKEHPETAQELYRALAGIEGEDSKAVELREKAGAYFLAKEGGAIFAFSKHNPEKSTD